MPNKPNLSLGAATSGTKCAKQTQFSPGQGYLGPEARGTYRAEQSQPGPSVPNKANSSMAGYGAQVWEAARHCGRVRTNLSHDRTYGGEAKSYWVPKHQAV